MQGGYPADWTNAKVTVRIKGDLQPHGAKLVLLLQGNTSKDPEKRHMVNQVLMGQPIQVTKDWSEQTITLTPDQKQWVQLGSRSSRLGFYGEAPISDLLRDANYDIIFVLFPLEVKPLAPVAGDMHEKVWERKDVDGARLPEGVVMLSEVKIEFP